MIRLPAAVRASALAALLGSAGGAAALADTTAANEREALYARYHEAAELARICRDLAFDQADIDRMAAVINGKVAGDIGAKRLPLLTAAQRDARALAENPGCASAEAQELLALYDADLAGAVD